MPKAFKKASVRRPTFDGTEVSSKICAIEKPYVDVKLFKDLPQTVAAVTTLCGHKVFTPSALTPRVITCEACIKVLLTRPKKGSHGQGDDKEEGS